MKEKNRSSKHHTPSNGKSRDKGLSKSILMLPLIKVLEKVELGGVVIRDSNGKVLACFMKNFDTVMEAKVVEAWALKRAIWWTKDIGLHVGFMRLIASSWCNNFITELDL